MLWFSKKNGELKRRVWLKIGFVTTHIETESQRGRGKSELVRKRVWKEVEEKMKEVFFFRDSEGFASTISDALRPDPHSSLRPP